MFDAARLRLALWYLAILTTIVGALSFALYRVLVHLHHLELQAVGPPMRHGIIHLFARDERTLAFQIVAVDLGVLILAALGAYVLAGRTLAPIRESMERQQRFAAAAAHELRTPITVLQGTLEVALLNRRTLEEYEQILENAAAEAGRMGALIAELLALARAEAGREILHLTPLDLRHVAGETAARLHPLAARKGQLLQVSLETPLPVHGDATKLQQALSNLVENAVTYTPASGTIRLIGRRERGHVILQVHDTGSGIDSEDLPHLFEPFYRVDAAHSDHEHAGLGLALSSWVARAHGGQLSVESRVGLGTVFTLSLPVAPRS